MSRHPDKETDRIERGGRVQRTERHENKKGSGSVIKKAFGKSQPKPKRGKK